MKRLNFLSDRKGRICYDNKYYHAIMRKKFIVEKSKHLILWRKYKIRFMDISVLWQIYLGEIPLMKN